jgi:hypothetical protein
LAVNPFAVHVRLFVTEREPGSVHATLPPQLPPSREQMHSNCGGWKLNADTSTVTHSSATVEIVFFMG